MVFFSKLKISAKLLISSAVFLIPMSIMMYFIYSSMTVTIEKSVDEHDGIAALHPAVLLMQKIPEYFNIFLGLEAGNGTYLDQQITGSIKTLEKELKRYNPV
jgi:hypothetical protein